MVSVDRYVGIANAQGGAAVSGRSSSVIFVVHDILLFCTKPLAQKNSIDILE